MKIDLHVHINRTSRCAKEEPEQMAIKAKEKGLDGIVILDHHYYPTDDECKKAEDASGIKVFKGIELSVKCRPDAICGTKGGANDVVLVSPITPTIPTGEYHKPINEKQLVEIIGFSESFGGLTILAHPFRKGYPIAIDLRRYHINCIEIASKNTPEHNRAAIYETSLDYDMNCVATSDAHKTKHLGNYCIETNIGVFSEIELAEEVKKGHYRLLERKLTQMEMPNAY